MRDEEKRRPICSARGRFRRPFPVPVGTHRWHTRLPAHRGTRPLAPWSRATRRVAPTNDNEASGARGRIVAS
ncbi:MAG: hypothetical protein AAFQ43_03775 [Bacteroidota bacterium]